MKLSLQVAGISGESSLSKKASNGSHQFTEYFEGNSTDALDIILFYGFLPLSKFERVVLFEEKIKCIFVRNRLMRI